ncbi:hypothetical protein [Wolbachia endosymbiont of Litomosoides sigmodontis]|uniref:hypothetical protein n=1 Tax=Wolbachia endosymbiont of Litomosoides sigmodontis TaxID=80850 RepID=UPI00158E04E7|nr:hypothetical protein [Wolbachia endosymbiont of Litomosoides sigmodontis]
MTLTSKSLDKKVVKSLKEMLKKVQNMHMCKKTKCCNCSKKHSITAVTKICCIFKIALTT